MVSGRSTEAVEANTERLADHLAECDDDLADAAYSLHATRRAFDTRRFAVATDTDGVVDALRSNDADPSAHPRDLLRAAQSVAFLFPGGGAHHPGMGRGLYDHEPEYRRHIDAGLARLRERHDIDLAPALFCEPGTEADAEAMLEPPSVQLPAIFLVEYALGKLYESWGIVPRAMAGHSLGENTAACLAGVMSFEDCLDLVVIRGAMMERAGRGGLLSVNLAAEDVEPYLSGNLVVAGINGPTLTAVSGTVAEVADLTERLEADGVEVRRVPFAYPVHSPLFDPHLGAFEAQLESMDLKPPSIPIASNLTGTWLTVEEATDPSYWVRQVRHTVRFADDVDLLLQQEGTLLVEVGPGASLSAFARQSEALQPGQPVLSSLRRPDQAGSDDDLHLLEIVGRLWSAGLEIDPETFHGGRRRRVHLPTYAFTHRDYYIEPSARRSSRSAERGVLQRSDDLDDWFQHEVWREQPLGVDLPELETARWLIFDDGSGPAERLAKRLFGDGHDVVTVVEGDAYARIDATHFTIAPEMGRDGYDRLVGELADDGRIPDRIVHWWTLSTDRTVRLGSSWFHHQQERGFSSLVHLAQAMAGALPESGQAWTIVTNGATAARGPVEHPEKATLLGPVSVIPRELAGVTVSLVDLDAGAGNEGTNLAVRVLDRLRTRLGAVDPTEHDADTVDVVLSELAGGAPDAVVAYRSGRRHQRFHDRTSLDAAQTSLLRSGGTYLVTGGLGGIGMFIADRLGRQWKANLVLVGRSPLPPETQWQQWLDEHGPDNVVSQRLRKLMALRDSGRRGHDGGCRCRRRHGHDRRGRRGGRPLRSTRRGHPRCGHRRRRSRRHALGVRSRPRPHAQGAGRAGPRTGHGAASPRVHRLLLVHRRGPGAARPGRLRRCECVPRCPRPTAAYASANRTASHWPGVPGVSWAWLLRQRRKTSMRGPSLPAHTPCSTTWRSTTTSPSVRPSWLPTRPGCSMSTVPRAAVRWMVPPARHTSSCTPRWRPTCSPPRLPSRT